MKLLEDKILTHGRVLPGEILKVDSFLNHQIDVGLLGELGKEWYKLFGDEHITYLGSSPAAIAILVFAESVSYLAIFASRSLI